MSLGKLMKAFAKKTVQGDLEEMTNSVKWIVGKIMRVMKKQKVGQMERNLFKRSRKIKMT